MPAASKAVEHTLDGSTYMTKGWPDEQNLPPSYAHVRSGETMMFHEAIKRTRKEWRGECSTEARLPRACRMTSTRS